VCCILVVCWVCGVVVQLRAHHDCLVEQADVVEVRSTCSSITGNAHRQHAGNRVSTQLRSCISTQLRSCIYCCSRRQSMELQAALSIAVKLLLPCVKPRPATGLLPCMRTNHCHAHSPVPGLLPLLSHAVPLRAHLVTGWVLTAAAAARGSAGKGSSGAPGRAPSPRCQAQPAYPAGSQICVLSTTLLCWTVTIFIQTPAHACSCWCVVTTRCAGRQPPFTCARLLTSFVHARAWGQHRGYAHACMLSYAAVLDTCQPPAVTGLTAALDALLPAQCCCCCRAGPDSVRTPCWYA
jgi:hypothetical protein